MTLWTNLKAIRWQLLCMAVLCILAQFDALDWLTTGVALGGLFGIDSNRTEARDERIAATDQAVVTRGGLTALGEEVVAVGRQGQLQTGGIRTNTAQGGRTVTNITTADPDLLRDALASVERQSSGFNESLAGLLEAQSGQTQGILDAVLGKLTDLASSTTTGGEGGRDKVIMWIALGLFVVVGIIFWRRKA